jgi:protein TonB
MTAPPTTHTPWAFTLTGAPSLPVTGEQHPLQREFMKWLLWANAIALAVGLIAFGAWFLAGRGKPEAPVSRQVHMVRYTELGVPPSISKPSVPQLAIAQAVAPPSIGVPEPVPEVKAKAPTIATQTEMSESVAPVSMEDLGAGTGDSLVVSGPGDGEGDATPAPGDFVAVDEQPVRLRIDPPVYPELAKEAGVEGTVLLWALVGKDGKIKDVRVIDGPKPLQAAAIQSARSAVYKPALVQHKPVELWVQMPVTFRLH